MRATEGNGGELWRANGEIREKESTVPGQLGEARLEPLSLVPPCTNVNSL